MMQILIGLLKSVTQRYLQFISTDAVAFCNSSFKLILLIIKSNYELNISETFRLDS